jgi:hypothetical protein
MAGSSSAFLKAAPGAGSNLTHLEEQWLVVIDRHVAVATGEVVSALAIGGTHASSSETGR